MNKKQNPPTCRRVREVGWLVGLHCFAFRRFASLRKVALLRFALRQPCFALLHFASRRNQAETPRFDSLPESDRGVRGRVRGGGPL